MKQLHMLNALVVATAMSAAAIAMEQTMRFPSAKAEERERCYGVVRAGKNDCGTPSHSCAAQSRQDAEPQSWLMLPKGLCDKIMHGHKQPPQ